MANAIVENDRPGEFILTELPGGLSRDTVGTATPGQGVAIPAGERLEAGTLLGRVSDSDLYIYGRFQKVDGTATDGSEVIVGILYEALQNDNEDEETVVIGVIVNKDAEIIASKIFGIDEASGTYGLELNEIDSQLRALGLKLRGLDL